MATYATFYFPVTGPFCIAVSDLEPSIIHWWHSTANRRVASFQVPPYYDHQDTAFPPTEGQGFQELVLFMQLRLPEPIIDQLGHHVQRRLI